MITKRVLITIVAITILASAIAILQPYLSPLLSELFPEFRERPRVEIVGELYGNALIADQTVEWRFTKLREMTSQATLVIVEVEGVIDSEVEAIVVGSKEARFVRGQAPLRVALDEDEFIDEVRVKAVLPPRSGRVLVSIKARCKGYERVEADVRDVILREEAQLREAQRSINTLSVLIIVVAITSMLVIAYLLHIVMRRRIAGGW